MFYHTILHCYFKLLVCLLFFLLKINVTKLVVLRIRLKPTNTTMFSYSGKKKDESSSDDSSSEDEEEKSKPKVRILFSSLALIRTGSVLKNRVSYYRQFS